MAVSEELALIRTARAYAETESKKSLRWFVSLGEPVPTDGDVSDMHTARQRRHDDAAAEMREVDRRRGVPQREPYAEVPVEKHPAFAPPEAAEQFKQPPFTIAAAAGIQRKRQLHENFSTVCWTLLARMRVENRLGKLLAAQTERASAPQGGGTLAPHAPTEKRGKAAPGGRKGGDAGAAKHADPSGAGGGGLGLGANEPNVTLLSMPSLTPPPTGTASVAVASTGTGAASGAAAAASASGEAPTSTTGMEAYRAKELKVPFEFKLKDYGRLKLPEHPLATCDPPEVPPNLPAGPAEVTELDADRTIPAVAHFQQPLVTLETFPLYGFPFKRTVVDSTKLVRGSRPQHVDDGGCVAAHQEWDYSQRLPSQHRPYDPVMRDLVQAPLPKPLAKMAAEDHLSDDDEEDELGSAVPTSFLDVVTSWMPPLARQAQQPQRNAATPPVGATSSGTGAAAPVEVEARFKEGGATAGGVAPLAFDPKPLHYVADETVNVAAKAKREAAQQFRDEVGAKLPPHISKVF